MRTRAAVLSAAGVAGPYTQTRPLQVEELTLDPPGAGEVLVRITAASICHSDLSVVTGARPRPLPMALGHEATGVIEEVGVGVGTVRPGDHVVFAFVPSCGACAPCLSGLPALCELGARANTEGTLLSGARPFSRGDERINHHLGVSGFAEHTVVAEASVVPVPADLPAEQATLFGCATLTGVGAVLNTAQARPGDSAVVFGLGGVGLAAVMGARLAGCHPVIAVDRVPSKVELALKVGASDGLVADEDVVSSVRELTHGGADFSFEAAGSAAVLTSAYAATRRGGMTVAVGLPHPSEQLRVPAVGIVAEERRLVGSYMGSAVPRRDVPKYVRLFRAGLLPIDALGSGLLTLEEINSGFDTLASAESVRQVIVMAPVGTANGR